MRIVVGLIAIMVANFLGLSLPMDLLGQGPVRTEVRNAVRDYKTERPITYSPSDPWQRGKLFNVHTKHYGKFYNCDGEEEKRNSQYICWKTHYDCDFPPRRGLYRGALIDLAKVQQRLRDGAGACYQSAECGCAECQAHYQDQPAGDYYGGDQYGTQHFGSNGSSRTKTISEYSNSAALSGNSNQNRPSGKLTYGGSASRSGNTSNNVQRVGTNRTSQTKSQISSMLKKPSKTISQRLGLGQKTLGQTNLGKSSPSKEMYVPYREPETKSRGLISSSVQLPQAQPAMRSTGTAQQPQYRSASKSLLDTIRNR